MMVGVALQLIIPLSPHLARVEERRECILPINIGARGREAYTVCVYCTVYQNRL
jgi:hypothetical protein